MQKGGDPFSHYNLLKELPKCSLEVLYKSQQYSSMSYGAFPFRNLIPFALNVDCA